MRVGLVIYGSIETLTGGYLYDRRLLDHLMSRGDRAEVISLPRRNHYLRALCDNASPSLLRRLTRAGFDVLLQDELIHPSLVFLNGWLRARARYPIVTIVHLLRSSEPTARRPRGWCSVAERRYLATVDAALYNSETTRMAVEALLGRGLRGVVAYPGGDHLAVQRSETELAARARATGPLSILSIANVLPGKGLCVLIDALCRLPAESWRLQIVGSLTMDRPYVERLRNLIGRAGLATHVCLVGTVPNARIPEYLMTNHLLVVPSHYEALGIAYLEAMRFGLPVIATTAGGAHEIVEHGREGFLVAPGDADALTRHLRLLVADRELLLRMGLAARRRAARHPTWDQSFERARLFLRSVVETHRPPINIARETPGDDALITHEQISDFYDWLSRYVQLSNWLSYHDRFAAFTMHKRLDVPIQAVGTGGRTAGLEYVNDRLLEVAGLPPEPRVLDAGCGFGGTVFHWQRRIGGRYDGLTLSRVQLRVARREARRRGIEASCRFHLRSYDAALERDFDGVVAIESLIHSADLDRTVPNLASALRPGGVLLILDDMATDDLDRVRPAEAGLLRAHWGCARYPTQEDYRAALCRARLTLIHEEDLSPLMVPRDEHILDRWESIYSNLHRAIPLSPVRTVVSAFLGGIALERLHASGDVHYRLFVARRSGKA